MKSVAQKPETAQDPFSEKLAEVLVLILPFSNVPAFDPYTLTGDDIAAYDDACSERGNYYGVH